MNKPILSAGVPLQNLDGQTRRGPSEERREITRAPALAIGQLIWRESEQRHYLLGRAIHCGAQLEVMNGPLWLRVRYEWHYGIKLICLAGVLYPDQGALFRWPEAA